MPNPQQPAHLNTRRWSYTSIAIFTTAWLILQVGGLFSPGLLDDVDSIYIQIAREMLSRHDFVTPTIDGIRFFDKPPLMYWLAAGSMRLFGTHDWAARIPLALGVLALLFAVYALGIRLFAHLSPASHPDRGGLYAALAMATSIGPYLYTRFYIPDILIALWMTLSVHLFLIALERINAFPQNVSSRPERSAVERPAVGSATNPGAPDLSHLEIGVSTNSQGTSPTPGGPPFAHYAKGGVSSEARPLSSTAAQSPLPPMLAFATVVALSLLTKGLIGIVFPIAFVLLYLTLTRQLNLLPKLKLPAATAVFAIIAAPWHILAALRNPAIPMPPGLGLPAKAGWAWFYLYNEHIARFLSKRIPHDYGQTPIWQFWLYAFIWMLPWAAFLPAALDLFFPQTYRKFAGSDREHEAAVSLILWTLLVLGFFTLSARQEYYSLPALPAIALLLGGTLAWADSAPTARATQSILRWSLWLLTPITTLVAIICAYFAITAPSPAPGVDLTHVLSSNPDAYNLSLGHIFDLTSSAMGYFRGPLITVAICMATLGIETTLIRRRGRTFVANLTLAAAMCGVLLAAHAGLTRFYPTLGSKDLALAINAQSHPGDLIILDGELTSGSTLLFYTDLPVHLINGRRNGPWFGSFWPDAPPIFEDDTTLRRLWSSPQRIFLFTYDTRTPDPTLPTRELTTAERTTELSPLAPVHTLASAGGKTILSNQ